MFVIISKKKYDAIMSRLENLETKFNQHKEQEKTNFSKVNKKLAEVEKKAEKRYVSDNFSDKKEKPKSWNQIMNEYLNGEEDNKGGN